MFVWLHKWYKKKTTLILKRCEVCDKVKRINAVHFIKYTNNRFDVVNNRIPNYYLELQCGYRLHFEMHQILLFKYIKMMEDIKENTNISKMSKRIIIVLNKILIKLKLTSICCTFWWKRHQNLFSVRGAGGFSTALECIHCTRLSVLGTGGGGLLALRDNGSNVSQVDGIQKILK